MKRENIGLDFDGVCGDTHSLKPEVAERLFGVKIHPDFFCKSYVTEVNKFLTKEQYAQVQRVAFGIRNFPEVTGATQGIRKLIARGYNVSVVTARTEKALEVAQDWIRIRKLNIPIVGVGYKVSKVEACKGMSVYLDDDSKVLKSLMDVVPNLFFFRWGYNVKEEPPKNVQNIFFWREFLDKIQN